MAEQNWEATEIYGHLTGSWPIEPHRTDTVGEVADELKYALLGDPEAPQLYPDIYRSFMQHGGNWQEVDWRELAISCLSDSYGDDWEVGVEFVFKDPFYCKDASDVAQKLVKIAAELEAGKMIGKEWSVIEL